MTLKNIANDLPNEAVAHPNLLQTSAIPMCDPQILYLRSTKHPSLELLGRYFLMFSRSLAVKQSVKKRRDVFAQQQSATPHRTFSSTAAKTVDLATLKYWSIYPLLQFTLTAWHQTTS